MDFALVRNNEDAPASTVWISNYRYHLRCFRFTAPRLCRHNLASRAAGCKTWYDNTSLGRVTVCSCLYTGSIFLLVAIATLAGTPSAGSFLNIIDQSHFNKLVIFTGCLTLAGGAVLLFVNVGSRKSRSSPKS